MDYNLLMNLAIDLGYELAMSGAETFRVEESITRILAAYSVDSDVFAIPNYIMITIRTDEGTPLDPDAPNRLPRQQHGPGGKIQRSEPCPGDPAATPFPG